MLILAIIVLGISAGWIADALINHRMRPDSWANVTLFGLIGSFIGGLLFSLLAGDGLAIRPSGLIGSIIGALIVTAIASRRRRSA